MTHKIRIQRVGGEVFASVRDLRLFLLEEARYARVAAASEEDKEKAEAAIRAACVSESLSASFKEMEQ